MDFNVLTNRIAPKLKAITHKLNGRYTAFNDEDLYQEALLHLWLIGNDLSDKTDSYILQNCYYFLKNHIRKIHKDIDKKSFSLNAALDSQGTDLEDFLPSKTKRDFFDEKNADLLIKEIYQYLDLKESKIIAMSMKGFTTRDMGKVLGVSHVMVVKIKKRIQDKCRMLKEELSN